MSCNHVERFNALLHSNIIKSNLSLPVKSELFATVWAYNNVGMNVSDSSNGFFIDNSPPVVRKPPTLNFDSTSTKRHSGQWDRSVLNIEWEFVDQESPITSHIISLHTHHDGHCPFEHIYIGAEQHFTINLEGEHWLNNGDRYVAEVTACNAAGLCTTNKTEDLLVDSTPPHMGGLQSHIPNTWSNFVDSNNTTLSLVNLTWYGFYDKESTVDKYFIVVSRSYYFDDLSGGIVVVGQNHSSATQNAVIFLQEELIPDDVIIVSIWAENSVGLNSSVSKTTLLTLSKTHSQLLPEGNGMFVIQKHSCDIHSCNKDCTCNVVGKPCVGMNAIRTSCNEIRFNSSREETYTVHGGLVHNKISVTASSACLSGHWYSSDDSNITVLRYEWSLGFYNGIVGEGIFDLKYESPWNDIGLRQQFAYCLPTNKSLIHNEDYTVYARVWYDSSTYTVFTSPPIKIDQTAPFVRRGRYIIEGSSDCTRDLDFINWTDSISACWTNVFSEQQSWIVYYYVGFGTSPNGKQSHV